MARTIARYLLRTPKIASGSAITIGCAMAGITFVTAGCASSHGTEDAQDTSTVGDAIDSAPPDSAQPDSVRPDSAQPDTTPPPPDTIFDPGIIDTGRVIPPTDAPHSKCSEGLIYRPVHAEQICIGSASPSYPLTARLSGCHCGSELHCEAGMNGEEVQVNTWLCTHPDIDCDCIAFPPPFSETRCILENPSAAPVRLNESLAFPLDALQSLPTVSDSTSSACVTTAPACRDLPPDPDSVEPSCEYPGYTPSAEERVGDPKLCVPERVTANVLTSLLVEYELVGGGCHTTSSCDVDVKGASIALIPRIRGIDDPVGGACPASNVTVSARCILPPLSAGNYVLTVSDDDREFSFLVTEERQPDGSECVVPR